MIKRLFTFSAIISTYLAFRLYYIGRKYKTSRSLKNRRVLVFGPSSTIGLELIKELSSRQAELIIASPDPELSEEILQNAFFESNVQLQLVDFSRLYSISEFCEKLISENKPIDIFISSAEITDHPPELTEDQVEIMFQTNYLCHFFAILKISQLLKKSKNGRVVFLSSSAHKHVDRVPKKEFHQLYKDTPDLRRQAFEYSKLCLVLFAWKLSHLISSPNLTVSCVDPGKYSNNLLQQLIFKSPSEAIQGVLFAILSDKRPPFYIEELGESFNYNKLASNYLLADILWKLSRNLCEKNHLM